MSITAQTKFTVNFSIDYKQNIVIEFNSAPINFVSVFMNHNKLFKQFVPDDCHSKTHPMNNKPRLFNINNYFYSTFQLAVAGERKNPPDAVTIKGHEFQCNWSAIEVFCFSTTTGYCSLIEVMTIKEFCTQDWPPNWTMRHTLLIQSTPLDRWRDRHFFLLLYEHRFLISRSKLRSSGCLIQKGRWHRIFRTSIIRQLSKKFLW